MANDDDEVRISANMDGDLDEALRRIERHLKDVDDRIEELGRTGATSGKAAAEGMEEFGESVDKAARSARRAKRPIKEVGDESAKTGAKAAVASTGMDKFTRSMDKAQKKAGGLRTIFRLLKWSAIITGVFALAGGLSALAAGAVMAVGALSPMVGVVLALPGAFAAAKVSMLAFKLAAEHMEPVLTSMKNQFTELGTQIAHGGLERGLESLNNDLFDLANVTGRGLAGIGRELGETATSVGRLVRSAPFLAQVRRIFHGLEPVVGNASRALLNIARILLNVISGAMPVLQDMAARFRDVTFRLQRWTAEQVANGKMTRWITKAWEQLRSVGSTLANFIVGLYRIFKIAGQNAGFMGDSISDASEKFRKWTGSARGQREINQYFQDAIPGLREMGRLLGKIAGGFASLATNVNVAPLLKQINDELAPALGRLMNDLSGPGGLGPALVSLGASMATFMSLVDVGVLTLFVDALAAMLDSIVWLIQNVPGATVVVSALLSAWLGFKLLGPVFGLIKNGGKAFSWVAAALTQTKNLSWAQVALSAVVKGVAAAFLFAGKGIVTVLGFIGKAVMAHPLIAALTVAIGVIVLLWEKCAWFRDAVKAVWEAIKTAALAVWDAISTAATVAFDAVAGVVMWLWRSIVKPVVDFIVGAFQLGWKVIELITLPAVLIIKGLIWLIGSVAKQVWEAIGIAASWLWNNILKPVFTAIGVAGKAVWSAIKWVALGVWNAISVAARAVWSVLQPIFSAIGTAGKAVWNGIKWAMNTARDAIGEAWNWIKTNVSDAVTAVGGFLDGMWDGLTSGIDAAVDWVKKRIDELIGWVRDAADFVGDLFSASGSIDEMAAAAINKARSEGLIPNRWQGGPGPGGPTLVGEHGPEPIVRGGRIVDVVGQSGPEIRNVGRGDYVVPNPSTLASFPGLARTLPSGVADAVARSMPSYRGAARGGDGGSLAGEVRNLAGAVREMGKRPPINVNGSGDVRSEVLSALREKDREDEARGRYDYQAGGG